MSGYLCRLDRICETHARMHCYSHFLRYRPDVELSERGVRASACIFECERRPNRPTSLFAHMESGSLLIQCGVLNLESERTKAAKHPITIYLHTKLEKPKIYSSLRLAPSQGAEWKTDIYTQKTTTSICFINRPYTSEAIYAQEIRNFGGDYAQNGVLCMCLFTVLRTVSLGPVLTK